MNEFQIDPFVGAIPLRFDMIPSKVESILGPPERSSRTYSGNRSEYRNFVNLGYTKDNEELEEIILLPGAKAFFGGEEMFAKADLVGYLQRFDEAPKLWAGYVVFPKLGVMLSGCHDPDEPRNITAVRRGYWEEYLHQFVPYETK